MSRRNGLLGAVALVLAGAAVLSALPVQSYSTGIDASIAGVGLGVGRGCYCHSADGASRTPANTANVSFIVEDVPQGYYQPGKKYMINLTFFDPVVPPNPSDTANHGGFNVWASAGKFSKNANSTLGGKDTVQINTDGTVTHTKDGDVLAYRHFTFDWEAPATNGSDVTFDILVNAVNGDNSNVGGGDSWSRRWVVLPGQPGAGGAAGAVDISKLGVPLRAYWLGIIGILSTMFLLLLSFYVIRSGSKFYEFGLPRGQVKSVKIRQIPAPKNRAAYAVEFGLFVILVATVVLGFSTFITESVDAVTAAVFILAVASIIAMMVFYYIRAFLPIVDVLEEETIEPLR